MKVTTTTVTRLAGRASQPHWWVPAQTRHIVVVDPLTVSFVVLSFASSKCDSDETVDPEVEAHGK